MKYITDYDELSELFRKFDDRDFIYDNQFNILTYELNTRGGERENETFYLKFIELAILHIPISFDTFYFKKTHFSSDSITGFKVFEAKECKELLPNSDRLLHKILTDNSICVRFYSSDEPTESYIICDRIEGWIKKYED